MYSSYVSHLYIFVIFFPVVHTIGHGINFYHFSTQSPTDLSCLLTNDFHRCVSSLLSSVNLNAAISKSHSQDYFTMKFLSSLIAKIIATILTIKAALPHAQSNKVQYVEIFNIGKNTSLLAISNIVTSLFKQQFLSDLTSCQNSITIVGKQ